MKRFLKKWLCASHVRNARMIHFALASGVVGVFLVPFDPLWLLGAFIAFQLYWICGLTCGWHRYFCHGAFETSRFWQEFMLLMGCASLCGHPGAFAAVHLQHHKYSDTPKDPHLEYTDAVFAATKLAGIKLGTREKKRFFMSPMMRRAHKYYLAYPVGVALLMLAISPAAYVYLWALPVGVMQLLRKYLLVLVPHNPKIGYRNYDTKDLSRNVWSLGILFGGEGYHNNHHRKPRDWNFAHKWWEFDPASLFVRMIKR